MNLSEYFESLWREQRFLVLAGLLHFVAFIVLAIASLYDSQEVLGINRWIKPLKFMISSTIYLWTLAVYLYHLPDYRKAAGRLIALGATAVLIGENILIVMQALRGTTSHFNLKTPLDSAIFGVMGLMILFNTFLVVYLTILYFRAEIKLPQALVWGMRLGLIVFLAGSIQGGYMSAQIGHAVGTTDGGAGLPLVNWSTEGGDLRIAHFVGLHALQALPLFALMVFLLQKRFSAIRPTMLTIVFSFLYFASFTLVFIQALKGKPLLGKEIIVTQKSAETKESQK
jgi:hypothetical protein